NVNTESTGDASFSTSQTGTIVYRTGTAAATLLTWFDAHGNVLGTAGDVGEHRYPGLSPDARRVVFARRDEALAYKLWQLDVARNVASPFTFHPDPDFHPVVWSPDGARVVFGSSRINPGSSTSISVPSTAVTARSSSTHRLTRRFRARFLPTARFCCSARTPELAATMTFGLCPCQETGSRFRSFGRDSGNSRQSFRRTAIGSPTNPMTRALSRSSCSHSHRPGSLCDSRIRPGTHRSGSARAMSFTPQPITG